MSSFSSRLQNHNLYNFFVFLSEKNTNFLTITAVTDEEALSDTGTILSLFNSLVAPRHKSYCVSGLTRHFGTADSELVHLTPISVMADYNKLEKVPLHVPPLEELRDGKDIRMDLNVR